MTWGLLALVLGVGLADSVNPVPIAVGVVLATRSAAAVAQFTLGSFAVTLTGGLILSAIPGDALNDLTGGVSDDALRAGEIIGGVTALGVGAWLLLRHRRHSARQSRWVSESRPLVLGGVAAAVDLPTALPYLGVIAAIVSATDHWHERVTLVVIYNVCYHAPLLAIVALRAALRDGAQPALDAIRSVVERWGPRVLGVAAIAIGIALIAAGLV